MKTMGIVRRLDELGRIVIPREYRKTHRINIGDPLEITALENGDIIISKVDSGSELRNAAVSAVENINIEFNCLAAVSDLNKFIVAQGTGKNAFIDRELPHALTKMLKDRRTYNGLIDNENEGFKLSDTGFMYLAFAPVMGSDDCFGGIFVASDTPVSDANLTTLRIAGRLIGESLQKY